MSGQLIAFVRQLDALLSSLTPGDVKAEFPELSDTDAATLALSMQMLAGAIRNVAKRTLLI